MNAPHTSDQFQAKRPNGTPVTTPLDASPEPKEPRPLPHETDCEVRLLGALLLNNDIWPNVSQYIDADSFYEPVHGQIYTVIADMISAGRVADYLTIRPFFVGHQAFDGETSADTYLAKLARAAETTGDPVGYALVIRDVAARRDLILDAQKAIDEAYESTPEAKSWQEIAHEHKERVAEIAKRGTSTRVRNGEQVFNSVLTQLENPVQPISTGFKELDESMGGGLYPEGIYDFEGASKRFKSGCLSAVWKSSIDQGRRSMFLTLEMTPEKILRRHIAGFHGLNYRALDNQAFQSQNMERVFQFRNANKNMDRDALFCHHPGMSDKELMAFLAQCVDKWHVDLIVLDYWQLVMGRKSNETEAAFQERTAKEMANFASDNKLPLVIASQLNREGFSLGSDGMARNCIWRAVVNKVEMGLGMGGQQDAGIWLDVQQSRDGPGGSVGSEDAPAFIIAPGPILKEAV